MRFASPSHARTFAALVGALALVPACGESPATPDAGGGDGGVADQGGADLGLADQGGVDAGPDELAACLADVTPGPDAQYTSTNRFRTVDGSVELLFVIQPDPDAFGTSGTTPFLPLALAADVDGTLYCVTDAAELDYQVSHHNFDDTLSVTLGGDLYTWKVDLEDYGNVPTYALTVDPATGPTTEEALVALGCSTAPDELRCFGPESW